MLIKESDKPVIVKKDIGIVDYVKDLINRARSYIKSKFAGKKREGVVTTRGFTRAPKRSHVGYEFRGKRKRYLKKFRPYDIKLSMKLKKC